MTELPDTHHNPEAQEKARKTGASIGEKLFDLGTYAGVAGVGTFALTIPVAYWAKYGKGAPYFKSASDYLVKKGFSKRIADEMTMTSALMQGGNLTIIPVKLIENYKPQIVDSLNHRFGDESGAASVDKEPAQTWGSLLKSRVVAWLSVFTGFRLAGMAIGDKNMDKFENRFAKGVCDVLGKPTHIEVPHATPGHPATKVESTHYRYGKIAALDVFATIAATSILYVGSRFFAKRNKQWELEHTPKPEPVPQASPAPAPSEPVAAQQPAEKPRFSETIKPREAQSTILARPSSTHSDAIAAQKRAAEESVPSLSA